MKAPRPRTFWQRPKYAQLRADLKAQVRAAYDERRSALNAAIEALGGVQAVAQALGVSHPLIAHWTGERSPIPKARAADIRALTGRSPPAPAPAQTKARPRPITVRQVQPVTSTPTSVYTAGIDTRLIRFGETFEEGAP